MCHTTEKLPVTDCPDPAERDGAECPRSRPLRFPRAKQSHRRGVAVARSVVDLTHHPDLSVDLRTALAEDGFDIVYQPEVELASGAVVGMEALLRWPHPARGLLGPRDFLESAEKAGLMPEIGMWVLEKAAQELTTWRDMPPHPTVRARQLWINVAATQFTENFVGQIADLVERYQLSFGTLGLEF